ncbi:SHOCT domain-containing protein [Haloarchaeobius baliensis]|uniref:SHOCT domain-containing protein n=1 Tax=Haloarchaeobius baliensis TaxID=1670458 RepID=UPI003F88349D
MRLSGIFNDSRYHRVSGACTTGGETLTLLVVGGVTALTLGVAFGLLALGVRAFWVAFPIGFGVLLPGAIAMARDRRGDEQRDVASTRTERPSSGLEVLRRRYAAGELSDEEFEHRVERLLKSEVNALDRGFGTDTERR